MAERRVIDPDLQFIRYLEKSGGESLKKCYQCATCSVVCELSPEERPFPRKEMLWAQWGQKERLIHDPDVWLCHQCNDCTIRCPRGARPGDVLAAVRAYIYEFFTFPRFMGKALATPFALPLLFLFPILIIAGLAWFTTGGDFTFLTSTPIVYGKMLAHGYIEMLFIGGNILIFLLAAVGLWRFWSSLQHDAAKDGGPAFLQALVRTILAIITHHHFGTCIQNRPRQLAHLFVFYGFIGAAITAGVAVLYTVILEHGSPIAITNPIKWLGALSGVAIFIGSTMMIVRRNNGIADVGAKGYADQLFLWMIFLVGLTGMLSWLIRLAEIPLLAYPVYFVHVVMVFFLLWYMPYSKFAHVLYRTLALVWAEQHQRHLAEKTQPAIQTEVSTGAAA